MVKAILLSQSDDKKTRAELLELDEAKLPERDVTVAVEYSTLNYKDALAITGRGAVVRNWALVPGIDLNARAVAGLVPAEVAPLVLGGNARRLYLGVGSEVSADSEAEEPGR